MELSILRKFKNKKYAYISEVFFSIQGEGPFLGLPCFFIRFAFCNLNCSFCDTKEKLNKAYKISLNKLLNLSKKYKYITITGGEPFLQSPFLKNFIEKINKFIILETNGSIFPEKTFIKTLKRKNIALVISPKKEICKVIKFWKMLEEDHNIKVYYKFLIFNRENIKKYIKIIKEFKLKNVYFQPVEFKNMDYINFSKKCLLSFLKEKDIKNLKVYFRPQLHKILKIK